MNQEQLLNLLKEVNKPTFIHLKTISKVDMNKKGNPYHDKVIKYTEGNYLIGGNYEDRVNNNIKKEGENEEFKASPNKIGKHISTSVLYNEKLDRYYLQVEYLTNTVITSKYIYEDEEINKNILEPWLKKTNYNNQPQEKKVQYKVYRLDSIVDISINGQKYNIHN